MKSVLNKQTAAKSDKQQFNWIESVIFGLTFDGVKDFSLIDLRLALGGDLFHLILHGKEKNEHIRMRMRNRTRRDA